MPYENITFCKSGLEKATEVLSFSAANGFTRRSLESWKGENMDAVLAFHDDRLIGAIPFACRHIYLANEKPLLSGYLSGVAIREDYRNAGLGSKLLQYLLKQEYLDGIFVNSEIADPAYRWYVRNGFNCVAQVQTVIMYQDLKDAELSTCKCIEITNSSLGSQRSLQLKSLFESQYRFYNGFEVRDSSFWNRRIKYHFYQAFNRYYLIMNNDQSGYAVISYNFHPKSSGKIDILEISYKTERVLSELLYGVKAKALEQSTQIIRCAVVKNSKLDVNLSNEGFTAKNRFDLLYFPIHKRQMELSSWMFFLYDYA